MLEAPHSSEPPADSRSPWPSPEGVPHRLGQAVLKRARPTETPSRQSDRGKQHSQRQRASWFQRPLAVLVSSKVFSETL